MLVALAVMAVACNAQKSSDEEPVPEDFVGDDLVPYNRAGCDPGSPIDSCGNAGRCCDTHDACIAREVNRGTATNPRMEPTCPAPYGHVYACQEAGDDCPAECRQCHDDAVACGWRCTFQGGEGCGQSACCANNTCDRQEACIDYSKTPPEVVTDMCECERRKIKPSPEPPRDRHTCCTATGYGCCTGKGLAPSTKKPCCTGLKNVDGRCQPDDSGNYCGDGRCGAMESRHSCCGDCGGCDDET
ncbi:MAG TPA: hypothetical protein VIV11_22140 [Kofleriaceae bacterium]